MVVADIHSTILAEVFNGVFGTKTKLADSVTSDFIVLSGRPVGGLSEDGGAKISATTTWPTPSWILKYCFRYIGIVIIIDNDDDSDVDTDNENGIDNKNEIDTDHDGDI